MANIKMCESRLREVLARKMDGCSPETLMGLAEILLSADLQRESVCGSFVGEIPNRELARDESLSDFIMGGTLDDSLLEHAEKIDPKLPLPEFRVALRVLLVRQGCVFDEDTLMALCSKVRAKGD